MKDFKLVAPCLLGVEGLVAQELRGMGAQGVEAQNGRVFFDGSPEMLVRANLCSRFSERIQILIGTFPARSFEELFEGVKALPWERWIGKDDSFPVKGGCIASQLHSIPNCQKIIKKAVVERLKSKYGIEWFAESNTLYQIQFIIMKDEVSIMLDTSGWGLHKRGYRKNAAEAPIKETLAAVLAALARTRTDANFYDPCCGSGTILIEAAMYAMHMAPGLQRKFSAQYWPQMPQQLWQQERDRARDLVVRDAPFMGWGSDIDAAAVELAMDNARKAGVVSHIRTAQADLADFAPHTEHGCVVCNPPYGERLLDLNEAEELYRTMGRVFPARHGWNYTIITPDEIFEECFGRQADKRRKLYNGMIKCQVYMFYKNPEDVCPAKPTHRPKKYK
ncbi:MAG: class I SAM-dependent RNA methyltransferase [Oscillospiraceae bacterium]|jgi:putative N6-adenine-specific DNA methylase|nr:class I SAM-dependent RNA methyltransferase [Oscillospiraceae bacterium]